MELTLTERSPTDRARISALVEELLEAHDPSTTGTVDFLGARFDAGLAWVHHPPGYGGLGMSAKVQELVDEQLLGTGAPEPYGRNPIGIGFCAPTIVAHGTEDQKQRWLRPLFTGEEVWCQLFSEPGAGSDVAGLSTRAVADGEEWVVNGQKVWTTLAHVARWGILLARSDPDVPKHDGLTYFVVDMGDPGIEVRPLRQMTGEAEFNEVYLTDVRVPDAHRLGGVGEGWSVAVTTLMAERAFFMGNSPVRASGPIGTAVELWRSGGVGDPVTRDRLMRSWIEAEVNRLTVLRAAQMARRDTRGPEGSLLKLASAEALQRIHRLILDLSGADGLLYGSYEMRRPEHAGHSETVQEAFLRSRAYTIEGGTSEILRNVLAERVLGLPAEVRTDKGAQWSQVPRNV